MSQRPHEKENISLAQPMIRNAILNFTVGMYAKDEGPCKREDAKEQATFAVNLRLILMTRVGWIGGSSTSLSCNEI